MYSIYIPTNQRDCYVKPCIEWISEPWGKVSSNQN